MKKSQGKRPEHVKGHNKGQWEWNVTTEWERGKKRDQTFGHQSEYIVPCQTECKLIYLFWLQ